MSKKSLTLISLAGGLLITGAGFFINPSSITNQDEYTSKNVIVQGFPCDYGIERRGIILVFEESFTCSSVVNLNYLNLILDILLWSAATLLLLILMNKLGIIK